MVRSACLLQWPDIDAGCEDMRAVPPLGRIGDPDDIIGSVRVDDGKVSMSSIIRRLYLMVS